MEVKKIDITWHPELPIFASEGFLKSVGDECAWLGGFDNGTIRCILPYTIIHKTVFKMVRFRVETLVQCKDFSIEEEKSFLNGVIAYFRSIKADLIIPATTNTVFRTYPDGADAAPYGSYVIDLAPSEETLWKNVDRITRQNINTAKKNGVTIRSAMEQLDNGYSLIVETFRKSKLPFMSNSAFKRYVAGLGEYGKIMIADYQGAPQSFVVFAYSNHCAYAVYAGNVTNLHQGANKLIYWEAICAFKKLGVRQYDFVGARINPEKGSKQESINAMKKRFGAVLKQGYMWKYSLNPLKYPFYRLASRWRSGGDIVDAERHKLMTAIV